MAAVASTRAVGTTMSHDYKAAVCRSKDLLSCARTALVVEQQKLQQEGQEDHPLLTWNGNMLHLYRPDNNDDAKKPSDTDALLTDGLTLLRSMEACLKQLQSLARRRGHTNDPTQQITMLTGQLEQDMQTLTQCIHTLQQLGGRPQAKRHWHFVGVWFQQVAAHYGHQLKQVLKVRGKVLEEQAQRRKLVSQSLQAKDSTANGSKTSTLAATARKSRIPSSSAASATPLFDSPLFTATKAPPNKAANGNEQPTRSTNGAYGRNAPMPSAQSANGYGKSTSSVGSYGGTDGYYRSDSASSGYGSYGSPTSQTGMRQRRGGATAQNGGSLSQEQVEDDFTQIKIQERQMKRETAQRRQEAQQAERQLGELGTLFGKMSTLISQQGETLENIEDDVEAALVDVSAGQEELTALYNIKKGNRALIIKTFAILNFLICFMKLYAKK